MVSNFQCLFKVVNVSFLKAFSTALCIFKVLLPLKSAPAVDSLYPWSPDTMVPFFAGTWPRRIWYHGVMCGFGRQHVLIHTDLSLPSTQNMATSALFLHLFPSHPFFYSPVTVQMSCSSFLRLSFQFQSLCSASTSSIPLLLTSVFQTMQFPPPHSCTFCVFFANRSPGLLFTEFPILTPSTFTQII